MTSTAEQIKSTIAQLIHLESVKKHFNVLKASVQTQEVELKNIKVQLDKEQDDIESLEKISITSLFHKVLGSKEAQLEKEKQEYLALAMKVKELTKSLELSQYELDIIENKISGEAQLRDQLVQLKNKRSDEIIRYNETNKDVLVNLYDHLDNSQKIKNELVEAYDAGDKTVRKINETIQHLEEAIKLGQHDMMGSRYADYEKRTYLDLAAESAYQAQILLNTYNKELKDIGVSDTYLHLNSDLFLNFTNSFFDNLITDWIMQTKIKNAYNIVDSLHDKILVIQESIKNEIDKYRQKIVDLKNDVDKILEG